MNSMVGLKNKAIFFRQKGKSYNEINDILGVPKSTLSTWLKDLSISKQVKFTNINKAKQIWATNIVNYNKLRSLKYQKEKEITLERYAKEIKVVDKKALFWIGLALFWAEGGKREEHSVRFVNSDPQIIKTIMRFYREICNVPSDMFRLRIYLHPNIKEAQAIKYWSKVTGIPENQYYKSQELISSTSKKKRNIHRLPNGTLHIYINDSALTKKIKGWIRGLSRKI